MAGTPLHEVQRPPFEVGRHVGAETLEEVLALLDQYRDRARIVAGGTDLMVELDRRVGVEPEVLIDLTRVPGLTVIHEAPDLVHLGPLVTHNQCASNELIREKALPLAQASLEVGSPALRNRATVVGNVVTASPANDTISALVALDASVHLASVAGQRTVPMAEFHTGVRQTVMEPNELVTGLSFPALGPDQRGVFLKLGLRRAQAISVVHLAMVLRFAPVDHGTAGHDAAHDHQARAEIEPRPLVSTDGTVVAARIALGSVAPTIVRSSEAESVLVGNVLDAEHVAAAARAAAAGVNPIDDLRADADYRTELLEVMISRGLSALRRGEERARLPDSPPLLGGPVVEAAPVASDLEAGSTMRAEVNGEVVSAPWHGATMLDWLREGAGLTGTKEGCAEGECGACTVHLDGVAVLSCLIPSGRVDRSTIVTIEGLAPTDGLHPVQQAFIDETAVQCGYCIPGFLMAAAQLREEDDVKLGLSGNLCRCTGYYPIEQAVGGGR